MPDSPFIFLTDMLPSYPKEQGDLAKYTGPTASQGDVLGAAGWDYITGKPTTGQVGRAQAVEAQQAMQALATQAGQLRNSQPDAQPSQLVRQLVMSEGGQRELMRLPAGSHTKALQEI